MKPRLKSKTGIALIALGFIALLFFEIRRTEFRVTRRSREAVLKTDLRTMRNAIDHYALDKQQAPQSLQDLVDAGYLRTIPIDPITGKPDWVPDFEGPTLGDPILNPDLKAEGLCNIRSSSSQVATNGSLYDSW